VNLYPSKTPLVTVLMPVYNGEPYLRSALESILSQTFSDFEFLIIDDGSTDGSAAIVESYTDPRIRHERNGANLGLIKTLNNGLDLARGRYVARMDCDDISLPSRLARQVAFMENHPEIAVCGASFRKFGAANKTVLCKTDPESIRCGLLFDAMVGHPAAVMRRDILDRFSLRYDPEYQNAEDYHLWTQVAGHASLANLGEALLLYRVHPCQVTHRMAEGQRQMAGKIRLSQLLSMGISPSRREFELHQAISTCSYPELPDLFRLAEDWLCTLKSVNDASGIFPDGAFSRMLVERWLTFCKKGISAGRCSPRMLFFHRLSKATGLGMGFLARFCLEHSGRYFRGLR